MSIEIKVSGFRHVHHNLQKVIKAGYTGSVYGIGTALSHLEDKTNEYINSTTKHPRGSVKKGGYSESIQNNWIHLQPWIDGNKVRGVLGNSSAHACIIGSKTNISTGNKSHNEISCINPGDSVLSKDGNLHKVKRRISDLRVSDKPNLIKIKCEHSYLKDGLILTDDHLVLTWDNFLKYPFWEEVGKLHIGDYIFKKIKPAWNKGIGERQVICKGCGKKFSTNTKSRVYCSFSCYSKHTDHNRNEGKHWNLSEESRKKHSGRNNPAWRGGISKEKYGIEWTSILKEKIRKRDNYSCQICGMKKEDNGRSLTVHHIDENKFNNSEENLITLCSHCHGKLHWGRDCELVTVDFEKFKPEIITKLEHIDGRKEFNQHNAYKMMKLYDLSIEGENSFVASGIIVHNSMVEFGVAGPIRPVSGPTLHFRDPNTGKWVVTKQVKGQQPMHYLQTTINCEKDSIVDIIRQNVLYELATNIGV